MHQMMSEICFYCSCLMLGAGGQDCTLLENIEDVSCAQGKCVIRASLSHIRHYFAHFLAKNHANRDPTSTLTGMLAFFFD